MIKLREKYALTKKDEILLRLLSKDSRASDDIVGNGGRK